MTLIGIAQDIVKNITMVAGLNDPQYKISPTGALKAVLENNAVKEISNLARLQAGEDRVIKVRAMQRGIEADVTTDDDCETTITPLFIEHEITKTLFKKIGILITEPVMRTFEEQAKAGFQVNGVPVPSILYEMILTKVNGLIQSIDRSILTAIEAGKGVNVVTGNNVAVPVNFSSTLTNDDGYVRLLTDAEANEVNGELMLIGSGVLRSFDILNKLKTAADSNGFGAVDYKVYNDPKANTVWGANEFFAVQEGSLGMADWQKYAGFYAGEKGGSMFFTVPIPVQLDNGELTSLVLDAQLKYYDCPIIDDGEVIAPRGWILLLSKSYGVYTAPATLYQAGDVLQAVNGIFHYVGAKATDVTLIQPTAGARFEIDNELGDPITVNQDPTKVDVTGITTSDNVEAVAIGATWDWGATIAIQPVNASIKWVLYSTADAAIATIDQAGVVTGVGAGEVVVTATTVDGAYSVTATVTVA